MRANRALAAGACAATLTLVAAACSSGTGASSSGDGEGSQTLSVASTATNRAGMEAIVELFKKEHPNVEIEEQYADTDQLQSTLRTQLSSGTAPDVFSVWPGNGNPGAMEVLAPNGFIADLSDRPWASDIPAGIEPVTEIDGTTYILPVSFSGIGAIYNQEAMSEVGEPPETWSELLAFCDAARKQGKVAFALGNQTDWVTQLVNYALVATTVYAENPDFADQMADGSASFADSGWKTAMNKYLEMNDRGCFQEDPLGTSFESSLAQVAKGDAVAVIQVTSVLSQLESEAPEGTEFGLFPVPATDDPSQTQMPGAAGGAYGVNADSDNKELALELIDFMGSPEGMNAYVEATGELPSIPNDQFEIKPTLEPLVAFQQEGKTVPYMDQLWPNPKVQATHFTVVQEVFAGEATPAEALADMDEAYADE
jgi:raffinose/stachyose/melibiose transport system substrate-binding protein